MRLSKINYSIVIPTHGRPKELIQCLEALSGQEYPHDRFEVIVVDDGSPLSSEAVVRPFQDRLNISLFQTAKRGPASARNWGASHARGNHVVFLDDDCYPVPNWLTFLSVHASDNPDSVIGGSTSNTLTGNPYSEVSHEVLDYLFRYYNRDPNHALFLASNNLAISVYLFHDAGGFSSVYRLAAGEDRELCHRLMNRGIRLIFAEDVIVEHQHFHTFLTFLKKHFNYGRGSFLGYRNRGRGERRDKALEPLKFYWNLLFIPYPKHRFFNRVRFRILVFLTQLMTGLGFLWEFIGFVFRKDVSR